MEKEEVLNNLTYFSRCLKLLKFYKNNQKKDIKNGQEIIELSNIREVTEDTLNSPTLGKLIKFLEKDNFLIIDKDYKKHRYYFDWDKLAKFLRESVFFKQFGKIIEITKSIYIY